ncbi:hypothetical protein [Amaricoccus solimangrovi]|uniref:DUF4168 domain-containing protein n=1 Tax=Amaricoccus solimangrovi TaxID=2589815 RepID=A0A501WVZ7_9RHOB|nr:hypothetical protein [Amaricoccus solimangrovi]TPE53598.1 hypothetical protein FJM51_00675 [Amaricoccus solimangrovi]
MRQCIAIVVTLSALASAAPVLATEPSLVSSAGLTPEQAQGMTLNEIAAMKFNRGRSPQDQIPVGASGPVTSMAFQDQVDASGRAGLVAAAGLTPEQAQGMTLNEIAAAKFNRNQSMQDRIPTGTPGAVSSMAFQDSIDVSSHYHLIRAAGLTPEQAQGMTLNEIVHMISPD